MNSYIINHINEISKTDWDNCAGDLNPFCSHGFLSALETSDCATAETGWLAQHIVIKNDNDDVVGVMPLYLKNHSQGEYVFDHGWANAYEQAGGHYYPKFQSSIPFSPVTGARLLSDNDDVKNKLLETAINHAENQGVSTLHFTFVENNEIDIMKSQGLLQRQDQQFHWLNDNYRSFNEFLEALSSRKRKKHFKRTSGCRTK